MNSGSNSYSRNRKHWKLNFLQKEKTELKNINNDLECDSGKREWEKKNKIQSRQNTIYYSKKLV